MRVVIGLRFEPDYCQNPAVRAYPPAPLVPPDVAIVNLGGYYVLRFTFHTCNAECNTWTLVYWQADDVPYADGTKTRVAVLNCSSPFPQSFDYRIHPIVLAASGEPAFDYWYGILDCNYNLTAGCVGIP